MAASSDRTVCTHPNATTPTLSGEWPNPQPKYDQTTGGIIRNTDQITKRRWLCPDCGQLVKEDLVDAASVNKPAQTLSAGAVGGTSPAATVTLTFNNPGANSLGTRIEKSLDGGTTWVAGVPATAAAGATTSPQTGLTTGSRKFRTFSQVGGFESAASNVVTVTVP